MKIRTAIALAALAVSPAFAAEQPAARTTTVADEAMTPVEKSTLESLQKEIAMLQQTVEQIRPASAERAILQAQEQADGNPNSP
ncbi:MAG: hypothetical protein ACXWK9_04660 [Myxococcaceae bacterium]